MKPFLRRPSDEENKRLRPVIRDLADTVYNRLTTHCDELDLDFSETMAAIIGTASWVARCAFAASELSSGEKCYLMQLQAFLGTLKIQIQQDGWDVDFKVDVTEAPL